jgi:hypothetical protein
MAAEQRVEQFSASAALASYLPARRTSTVYPLEVLQAE